jgi:N-acetylglucosamine-6-phosphate deacetylase
VADLVIQGGDVLHAGRIEPGADVRIVDGRIAAIGSGLAGGHGAGCGTATLDAAECWVLPGLVDIHTHGLRDAAVDRDDIHRFAAHQLSCGVTACLPTLAGSAGGDIARVRAILAETRQFASTPNLAGFRPEILYLARASGGPSTSLALPDDATTRALWDAAEGRIPIWDVSPELPGAIPFIAWCRGHGVAASMAHSDASIAEVRAAVDAGLCHVTHFYDLFPFPREIDPGVYPAGVTDYIATEDRLSVEIIPDGVHVHPLLVEVALRCKGAGRVAFVTDSLKGSGLPPGTYEGLIPGEPVEVTERRGIRRVSDGELCGSAITQLDALRNAVTLFGRSIPEASRLCSETPARIAGLARKGSLASGMDGDAIVLDRRLALRATVLGGAVAWRAA